MIAVCSGLTSVRLPSKGEDDRNSGCTCCSLQLLCGGVSTCSHGCCVAVCVDSGDNRETIHTRSGCCLQPLSLSQCSFILRFLLYHFVFCCPYARMLCATLYPLYPPICLSVFLSPLHPSSLYFFLSPTISFCLSTHTNTNKHSDTF